MRSLKKLIATLVATVMMASTVLSSGITAFAADGNTAPEAPTNTKVELLENPYGINTKDPSFSWAMVDADKDEVQTAYRIVVGTSQENMQNQNYIKDTDWVSSSESSYIKAGLSDVLKDNSLYYWSVQLKDKDGKESPLSEPQAFTTAVGDGWESINGIWVDPNAAAAVEDPFQKHGWTNYAVEMDMKTSVALGVVFRAQDNSNGYMIQFRYGGGIDQGGNTMNPHTIINGGVKAYGNSIKLADKGIELPNNEYFRVKIAVYGEVATVYINTGDGFKEAGKVTFDGGLTYGSIGFRNGSTENGYVDNIDVYPISDEAGTKSGDSLYSVNFDDGQTPNDFNTGNKFKVENGALYVPTGNENGTIKTMVRLNSNSVYPGEGSDTTIAPKGNFAFLRNEFNVDNKDQIEKAVVNVTAKSPEKTRQFVFNLYMNGQFVGLGPARFGTNLTNGKGVLYYNTYDVTNLLQNGENVIGAINYTQDEKSFLCQMTVFYKDGSSDVLVNSADGTWKALDGTNIFGDNGKSIGTGYFNAAAENINANLFPYGWNEPGYDDSAWTTPVDKGAIVGSYELNPYDADNVNRYLYDSAVVKDMGNGRWFVDLGKEIVGGLHLELNSPVSQEITLHYGEEGNAETGDVQWQMNTGNKYEEKWTLKEGEQTIENIGMKTFRYVEILNVPEGVTLTTDNFKGLAMHQEFSEDESSFNSSDDLLNRIYDTMKYTIKATNQDLMVDSQSRERGAYEGDVLINQMSSYSFEDDYSLARFSMEYLETHRTWPVEYVLYMVNSTWYDYLYTGNKDSMMESYEKLKTNLVDCGADKNIVDMGDGTTLVTVNHTNVNQWNSVLVDWPVSEHDGYNFSSAWYNTVMNAVTYGGFVDMAKIATELGKTDDAKAYQEKADKLKAGMIKYLYNSETGAVRDGLTKDKQPIDHYAQHATAFALAYGVYEDQAMADKMADYIRSQGKIKTSVYGSYFVLDGLYRAGAGDVANAMMMDRSANNGDRTWAYMIDTLGATITTEAWNETNKGNMTYSHPWGSAPGSQIIRGLFGIQPTKAGYSEFQVKLQPEGLEYASIKVPTLKGSVQASFDTRDTANAISTTVTIPANTKANVMVPTMGQDHGYVSVDGTITQVEIVDGYYSVELGSGNHTIAVPNAGKLSAMTSDSSKVYVGQTDKISTIFTTADGEEMDAATVGTLSYESSNPEVASVDAQGTITYNAEGSATITVTAELKDVDMQGTPVSYTTSTSFTVSCTNAKVERVYISVDGDLYPNATVQATLKGVLESGEEVDLKAASFTVDNPEAFTVDENGVLTGVAPGEGTVIVSMTEGLNDLVDDFDLDYFAYNEMYSDNFDNGNNTFDGLQVQDGAVVVNKGNKVFYDNEEAKQWTDYTVSAKVKVTSNAANITFRATDSNTFYLWQFRADTNMLKTHVFSSAHASSQGFQLLGEYPISNLKAGEYNDITIRVEGNKFTTYVNGEFVNATYNDELTHGSVGVRNGSSESFLMDDLFVGDTQLVTTLDLTVNEPANKNILNKVIDYAEDQKNSDDFNNVIADVQKSFNAALDNAKAVAADPAASQETVDEAWQTLMKEIHKLGFVKGDLTNLKKLIEVADDYDLTKYVEAGQAEFIAALEAAKAVVADGDNALQDDVTEATDNLLNAMMNLRLKADKSILEEVVNQATGMDLSQYTDESVAVLNAALEKANAVLADETLTEDQQNVVNDAVDAVKAAMDGLQTKSDESNAGNTSSNGQNNSSTNNGDKLANNTVNAATTGDVAMPIILVVIAIVAAIAIIAAVVISKRKNKNQ